MISEKVFTFFTPRGWTTMKNNLHDRRQSDQDKRIRRIAEIFTQVMTAEEYTALLDELNRLKPEEKEMYRPPD